MFAILDGMGVGDCALLTLYLPHTFPLNSIEATMYISITGLELKAFYHAPKFWLYAVPAMIQAKSAPGNILAEPRNINGVHHTLSVWEDRRSMLNYMRTDDHVKAMKIFDDIATGKTYGYESDVVPSWEEVVELYNTKARVVGKAARKRSRKQREDEDEIKVQDPALEKEIVAAS